MEQTMTTPRNPNTSALVASALAAFSLLGPHQAVAQTVEDKCIKPAGSSTARKLLCVAQELDRVQKEIAGLKEAAKWIVYDPAKNCPAAYNDKGIGGIIWKQTQHMPFSDVAASELGIPNPPNKGDQYKWVKVRICESK
jgi:hypothetical protein